MKKRFMSSPCPLCIYVLGTTCRRQLQSKIIGYLEISREEKILSFFFFCSDKKPSYCQEKALNFIAVYLYKDILRH